MQRSLHIILFIILTGSLACRKNVEIKLPPLQKRLVVHGYIALGEYFKVSVGKTVRDHTTGKDTWLDNALVLLYANGELKDTLHHDSASKTYLSEKIMAENGISYTIKVQVDGYPAVEATATGTTVPPTQSLQHFPDTRTSASGAELDDIRFSFQDPAAENNFYLTAIYPSWLQSTLGCVFSTDPAIDKPQTSVLPFDDGDCITADQIFFTDRSFNGQLKTIHLSTYSFGLDVKVEPDGTVRRPYMKRYAISEAFYDYFKFTSTRYDLDELPFFTESTDVKGNITNGFGIFTIFDVRTDTIR